MWYFISCIYCRGETLWCFQIIISAVQVEPSTDLIKGSRKRKEWKMPDLPAVSQSTARAKVPVPVFSDNYEQYSNKVKIWQKVCGLPKNQQALVLWLNLPDNHSSDIKDKIFNEIGGPTKTHRSRKMHRSRTGPQKMHRSRDLVHL